MYKGQVKDEVLKRFRKMGYNIDCRILEELNRVENEELRRGYYLGIINQRGVHWIDPEGKPELELAEDYENKANIAESRGYSRYAGILRGVADEFKREAKSNILEAKNGDDE